jgi:hypothetical protein
VDWSPAAGSQARDAGLNIDVSQLNFPFTGLLKSKPLNLNDFKYYLDDISLVMPGSNSWEIGAYAYDSVATTTTSIRPTTTTTSVRPTTTTSVRPTTTTTSCVAPGKTSLYSVSLNGGKTPTFSWTAVSNVSGYYVDVCNTVNTDCITNGGAFTGKNAGNTTSFNWGATFGPGTWYYRVNAYRDCGGNRYWTSSNVGSFIETNNAPTLGSVGVAQYSSCGTHNQTYPMASNATFDTSWYIQWLGNDDYGVDKGFYSMKLHSSPTWPSNTYFTRDDSVSRCMNYYGINTDNWAWLWPAQAASSSGLYDIKLGIRDIYGTETSITYTNITIVK